MNSVRDVGRWKGSLLAKYALASYWYFRVILEDRSPGLTYALQGEEVPFISCWDITSVLDIGGAEEIPANGSSLSGKSLCVFTKEFP